MKSLSIILVAFIGWIIGLVIVFLLKKLSVFIHKIKCGGHLKSQGTVDSGGDELYICDKCGKDFWL